MSEPKIRARVEDPTRKLSELEYELKDIPVAKINDAGRIRQDYGNIKELELSIIQKGLITPITVMRYEEPFSGFEYFLLAGGRRLRAVKNLKMDTVPARIYPPGLNAYEIRAIELEENIRRKDMTDAERLKSLKEIHDLWTDLYGKKASTSPDAKGHSLRDTAEKLGMSVGKVSEDIEIAKWLERVPELAKLKTKAEMKKFIREAKRQVKVDVKKEVLENHIPKEDYEEAIKLMEASYVVGDFFKAAKKLEDESFGFADIDIDFPMDTEEGDMYEQVKTQIKAGHYINVTTEEYPDLMERTLNEVYRVLEKDSWAIVWFGIRSYPILLEVIKKTKFKTNGYIGRWYKTQAYAHTRNPYVTLGHTCEYFLYLKKGTPRLVQPHIDMFSCPPNAGNKKAHPYEKPVKLMTEILSIFSTEGTNVLVPFAGSGNTLIAAFSTNRRAVGFDLSTAYKPYYEMKIRELIYRDKEQK